MLEKLISNLQKYYKKFRAQTKSTQVIIAIIAIFTLWMLSGVFTKKHHPDEAVNRMASVKISESNAVYKSIPIKASGIFKAINTVALKIEVDGKVSSVIAHDGEFLTKGAPILVLDPEDKKKLYDTAKFNLESASLNLKSTQALYEKHLSSDNALSLAQSNFKAAEASLERAKADLDKTVLKAPFDGFIDLITVHKGDFLSVVANTNTVANFSVIDPILVYVDIPQSKINLLSPESEVVVKKLHDDEVRVGKIKFISKQADPETHMFRVEIHIENQDHYFSIGGSAEVSIYSKEKFALHYQPKSAIVLDTKGKVSIKTVDDKNIVHISNVEIVDEDDSGFYVLGLSDKEKVIVLGAAFVKEGQEVVVQSE